MLRLVIFLVASAAMIEATNAQVRPGVGCNRQATYDLCIKCNQIRGTAGATGGHNWCTRNWTRPSNDGKR